MGLTLVDLVLLAAPLVILYAIVHTLENVEKECGDSHPSDEPHQTNNFYPRKLRLRRKRRGGINV